MLETSTTVILAIVVYGDAGNLRYSRDEPYLQRFQQRRVVGVYPRGVAVDGLTVDPRGTGAGSAIWCARFQRVTPIFVMGAHVGA